MDRAISQSLQKYQQTFHTRMSCKYSSK